MATPIHVPKINNNDDEVKLIALEVSIGESVKKDQVIAQIETDKAIVDVEAAKAGYVLAIYGELEEMLEVGNIFMWLGESADEKIPELAKPSQKKSSVTVTNAPTAKARALLNEHGLVEDDIPVSGERLSVSDIQEYISSQNVKSTKDKVKSAIKSVNETTPIVSGVKQKLEGVERGMLSTVVWHRDEAVPGYIELAYSLSPWESYAQTFSREHNLLLDPLLSLMAWRLVEISLENPRLNATISEAQRHEYDQVNLGFTVQAGSILYLTVIQEANILDELAFTNKMVEIQRKAAAHKLKPEELQNATISFSSMSRWNVKRHVPILPPCTALMIAHTVNLNGEGVLGATYDHRVLNGGDVVNVLKKLSTPSIK